MAPSRRLVTTGVRSNSGVSPVRRRGMGAAERGAGGVDRSSGTAASKEAFPVAPAARVGCCAGGCGGAGGTTRSEEAGAGPESVAATTLRSRRQSDAPPSLGVRRDGGMVTVSAGASGFGDRVSLVDSLAGAGGIRSSTRPRSGAAKLAKWSAVIDATLGPIAASDADTTASASSRARARWALRRRRPTVPPCRASPSREGLVRRSGLRTRRGSNRTPWPT